MNEKTENNLDKEIWKPNKQNLRIDKIVAKLKTDKIVTIKELSETFNVTKMTIYRDINTLREKNVVTFINGVVMYNDKTKVLENQERKDLTYYLPTEIHRNTEEKKRIVQCAADLIEAGDSIYIDSGSTMEFLSQALPENKNLVVGCHAFYVLVNVMMKKGCDIFFPGGYFHSDTLVFESIETIQFLKRVRIKKAFFAAGGVDSSLGITCENPFVVNIKRAMLESSHTKILLVDSSKFNTVKKVYYADLKEFDIIITDNKITENYKKLINQLGIKLYIV